MEHTYTVVITETGITIGSSTITSWVSNDSEEFTAGKALLISTAEELKDFATAVNSGISYEGITLTMTQNIDVNCSESDPWISIGTVLPETGDYNIFKGTLDGNGYTISGLYIDDKTNLLPSLFGYIGESGCVKNLTTEGQLTCTITNDISYVAGISSLSYGYIYNCINKMTLNINTVVIVAGIVGYNCGIVENCVNKGSIYANSDCHMCGLVGNNAGTVLNCSNLANLESSGGGSVIGISMGNNAGNIINCHNSGNITGTAMIAGIILGNNAGNVINCYNTGTMSGSEYASGIAYINTEGAINNCYNVGAFNNNQFDIGVMLSNDKGTVTNCYYSNGVFFDIIDNNISSTTTYAMTENTMKSEYFTILLNNNAYDYNTNSASTLQACAWVDVEGGYPTFDFNSKPDYTELTSIDNIRYIETVEDLSTFVAQVSLGSNFMGDTVTLKADIDFKGSDANMWSMIGSESNRFEGLFEGGGHTISGIYYSSLSSFSTFGMFGAIGANGKVRDLAVEGSVVLSGDMLTVASGIAYTSYGVIENCINKIKLSGMIAGGFVYAN
ncbi:MAG: hypothetical protein R3Y26_01350 [Rikenellaceae bacterium]